mmetsp:Transcript_11152/g.12275  ORF Transcript_11152/g.12275 Transcript_11152/m.12275 type:complete len:236 (-) Transcript_11152:52-759(-)
MAKSFKEVTAKVYKDQAKFFLNAYWPELRGSDELEKIWQWTHKFIELDHEKEDQGSDLDEFNAHRFLEQLGITQRVVELRESLREVDMDFNKRMALIEYLLYTYKKQMGTDFTIKVLLSRPQGSVAHPEVMKAMDAVNAVNQEINKIEKEKKRLEELSKGTGVKAMQAKQQLAALLCADPTALNRALVTAEAALRKVQKIYGSGEGDGNGAAQGTLWWMSREIEEAKKYKPQRSR